MKKMTVLQARARERFGFFSSLVIHFILFIALSLSGVFMQQHHGSDVTEVMFFAGGGGGGGGGGQDTAEEEEASAAEEASAPASAGDDISYAEKEQAAEKPGAVTPKPAIKPKAGTASVKGGSGTGSGGGHGSGQGTGTGSGIGPGSGSGSGGGHGSGHGTGIGSGVGPDSGIARQPAVPPRVVSTAAPVYPAAQKENGVEGVAVVQLIIGVDGRVESAEVVRSSGSGALDEAAAVAARKWRFTAARGQNGQKVRCYYNLPIRFSVEYR